MFRATNFDKLLDKATSNLRLDPDWPTILQICDLIRQNDCTPKYAVAAVKKKLYSQNPHQAMFALLTLESIVKNCGSGIHDEVGSKAFCETLRDLVKTTQHENLRSKILELIQAWAFAFRNSNKYRSVQDTINILKTEGYKFPVLKESDAMFSADTAPEWADGEVCHRCRVVFSLMVRRHHCRACGQVFCQQCSSKTSTLPKFGIEKEVRVCDACYDKVSRPPPSTTKLEIVDTSSDYGPTQPQKRPPGKSAEELQEEEELQLALALSQSEAEQKEKERRPRLHHIAPDPTPHHPTVSPTPSSVSASPEHSTTTNSELSRYLDRGYWEQRLSRDTTAPTAPVSNVTNEATEPEYTKPATSKVQDDDAEDKEIDEFVETLKSQVEIFVNRMKSNSSRGRSIANDTSVQTLFMNITAMHSRLLRYIQQQDDKRVYLESLQDKVNQVRDSRAALDTLRAEHAARLAAQAEAAERQRQMQMASKLQAMRKKKHEYLQYQRQVALQKVQEQEREMQMRQEQQKHQYLMSTNNYYVPGVSMHQFQPGYPNQPMYANPQFHPQMMPTQATADGSAPMPGQPQMPQTNMPMSVTQMGTLSQSMPQLTNTFAMSNSGMAISQAPMSAQPSMNQQNMRPAHGQQLPLQQQLMLQQMHQMRMSSQPGMHQMMQQNIANGLPGQNIAQNNQSTQQLSKQNVPNQSQQTNAIMPPMTMGQQNIGQPMMNPSQPMLNMQMQNMRLMQNPSNANQQVSGYPINVQSQQNGQQPVSQAPNLQQPSQIPNQSMLPGQQMLSSQSIPGQPQSMPNNIAPTSQSMPQVPQTQQQLSQQSQQSQMVPGQQMPMQGQPMQPPSQQVIMQGQQMLPQGQQMLSHQIPQAQLPPGQQSQQMITGQQLTSQMQTGSMTQQIPQASHMHAMSQQMPGQAPHMHQVHQMTQGQQMPPGQQVPQGHQMPQGPHMSQGLQMPQGPQLTQGQPMSQGPSMPQGPPMSQGQQMPQHITGQQIKMQPQNVSNGPPGQQLPPPNQQAQQSQTPNKSEHNNNSAELISFD